MRVLSGVQPSGSLHIGNYLGALKQFKELQDKGNECFFSIVDLHALTTARDKKALSSFIQEEKKVFLSIGLDPEHSTLFVQSQVPAHTSLAWILSTLTSMGDLERMTQFKDKSSQGIESNAGLFTYPILMAADILVYKTEKVPVGDDQLQHLELTREIARRFNSHYEEVFIEPKAITTGETSRVMSLSDPTKKMSKSLGENHYVGMFEEPDSIKDKFKRCVTDSETTIAYDPKNRPGIANLLSIYAAFTDIGIEKAQEHFKESSYAALKEEVASTVIETLAPIREKFLSIKEQEVESAFEKGKQKAIKETEKTMDQVYKAIGV